MDYNKRRVVLRKKLLLSNTWQSEEDGIILGDSMGEKATINLAKSRDSFSFKVRNVNDNLYEQFLSGDGITQIFKIKHYPIPTEHLYGTHQKFFVYINGTLKELFTDYVVVDDEISFVSAPIIGNRNIRIVYPVIESDDLVDIYFWQNNDFDLLTTEEKNIARKIEGIISTPSLTKNSLNIISVNGYGLIDTIFSGMAFAKFDQIVVNRSHLAIQQIISQLNKFNPNRKIYGESPSEWTDMGNDESPGVAKYNSSYRTAIQMIEELSGSKYTGDGQYIYWVEYNAIDDRYEFRWKSKPNISSDNVLEGVNPNDIKIGKSTDGVLNVIIYNAGTDCNGRGIEGINFDFTIAGFGSKWKYVSTTSTIAQDLINAEFEDNKVLWDVGNNNQRTESYPIAYPYTLTTIKGRTITGIDDGSFLVAYSDKDFNEYIRSEAHWQAKFRTNDLILKFSKPRYKGTLFIPYNTALDEYALGNIYNINLPSFGLNNKKLRLTQIDYEFYGLQLTIEEDEETVLLS